MRRTLGWLLLTLAAYGIALVATLPARLLLGGEADSPVLAVGGTVWSGEAALGEGHGVRWIWAPGASLLSLSFAAEWEMTGPDTALKGRASWRPSGTNLSDVEGRASGLLLSALAPRLPIRCDFPMEVRIGALNGRGQRKGADGRVESGAGNCGLRDAGGIAAPVPPLVAVATTGVGGSTAYVAPRGEPGVRLLTAAVTPSGRLSVRLTPAGVALFPGLGQASWEGVL